MDITPAQRAELAQAYKGGANFRQIVELLNELENENPRLRPGPMAARQRLLEEQAAQHQAKADAALLKLETLKIVPQTDPYEDGQVLRVAVGRFTYALLRTGGAWYATGRDSRAPYRAGWGQVADWLVTNGVTSFVEMTANPPVWLNGQPMVASPLELACPDRQPHDVHVWDDKVVGDRRCPGLRDPIQHRDDRLSASESDRVSTYVGETAIEFVRDWRLRGWGTDCDDVKPGTAFHAPHVWREGNGKKWACTGGHTA